MIALPEAVCSNGSVSARQSSHRTGDRPAPSSDTVSSQMSRMPRRDTTPEMQLRRALHARGHRYRVNVPVPGRPRRTIDIAFRRERVAVFVDGCFWHLCPDHAVLPKANGSWWEVKLLLNVTRDRDTNTSLEEHGWTVVRIWEHQSVADAVQLIEIILAGKPAEEPSVTKHDGVL